MHWGDLAFFLGHTGIAFVCSRSIVTSTKSGLPHETAFDALVLNYVVQLLALFSRKAYFLLILVRCIVFRIHDVSNTQTGARVRRLRVRRHDQVLFIHGVGGRSSAGGRNVNEKETITHVYIFFVPTRPGNPFRFEAVYERCRAVFNVKTCLFFLFPTQVHQ